MTASSSRGSISELEPTALALARFAPPGGGTPPSPPLFRRGSGFCIDRSTSVAGGPKSPSRPRGCGLHEEGEARKEASKKEPKGPCQDISTNPSFVQSNPLIRDSGQQLGLPSENRTTRKVAIPQSENSKQTAAWQHATRAGITDVDRTIQTATRARHATPAGRKPAKKSPPERTGSSRFWADLSVVEARRKPGRAAAGSRSDIDLRAGP
jgi:hypothetical protein